MAKICSACNENQGEEYHTRLYDRSEELNEFVVPLCDKCADVYLNKDAIEVIEE